MLPNNSRVPARLWVVLVSSMIMFSLAGCIGAASTDPVPQIPCAVEEKPVYVGTAYPELQSDAVKEIVDRIYNFTIQNINDTAKVDMAKREALNLLKYQTERWSAVEYIQLENQPRVRVIISFIGPALIRTIILNQWLASLNTAQPANLEQNTNNNLNKFDTRKDLAFLMLIQPEQQQGKIITILPGNIALSNTTGVSVTAVQSDSFLGLPLNSTDKTQAGFLFYPIGRMYDQVCRPVLDLNLGTSLMLKVDAVTVSDKTGGPFIWTLYFPLLESFSTSLFIPNLTDFVQNNEHTYESALSEPPSTTFDPNSDEVPWRDIGRFIWWKLTMEHEQ